MAGPADPTSDGDLHAIRRSLEEEFSADAVVVPEPLGESGSFASGGWSFEYRLNDAEGAPCLDVIAQAGDEMQVWRFHPDGTAEPGPSFTSMVIYDPDVDRSEADARRRYEAHNAQVADVLRARGLL